MSRKGREAREDVVLTVKGAVLRSFHDWGVAVWCEWKLERKLLLNHLSRNEPGAIALLRF